MQKQACREFAERQNGWVIKKEFLEKGVSGFKVSAENRDAIQELKAAAERKEFDVLLVFMFDRLGRKQDETPFIVEWFNEMGVEAQNAIISEASFIIRKTAHLSLYLILGVLSFLNIAAYNIPFALKPVLSLGFSSAYSISDEIHQRFVPGRSCELRDVLIDVSGAIIGIALVFIIFSIKKGGRNMRKKELLKLNEQLFEKAENAIRAAEELKRENSSLLSKIEELEKKLSGVKEAPKPSAPLQTIEKKMISEVKLKNETE
jgi:VanZ family protein